MASAAVRVVAVQPRAVARGSERGPQTPRMCAARLGLANAAPRCLRQSSSLCPSLDRLAEQATHVALSSKSTPWGSTVASPLRVTCMANPRRVAKVQQQMRREISTMLQEDKNLRKMLSPEERMGVDNVLSVMCTVSDVEVSNDLQVVKVFVSILGDERGKKNAIAGMKRMEGYVRRNIGKRVSLRLTPEIRFVYDDSFERGQKVSALLDSLREEREGVEGSGSVGGGGRYTKKELLAVEDTITNPFEDEDDDEDAGNARYEVILDDDDDVEDGEDDEEEDDDEDITVENLLEEVESAEGAGGGIGDAYGKAKAKGNK
mmetsp:Transcript_15791/g.38436  ORF Transcript_15791/g.38436 Transcript_15791/m.38436 type:complete len:318 (+) Transcript_15791:218-1171(+)|eukprot:CAMPEP_0197578856 /NCGR_PEP_ID=MMETSP1326-20131121/2970_1 /TAXON_ID=1155430 /ORGANISM="Genus nov. species nov., Strain RCC2288" /LENGTH=317 /DNA_ID=CAMNT_0043142139 /DNA_START=189 /DNA_END=1142 /DNA_ORIENTATION=-